MNIVYDSIPVYNYSYLANGVLPASAEWTDSVRNEPVWTCADWITWFNALSAKYGEEKAKTVWKYFWAAGVSKGGGGLGLPQAGSGLTYDSVPLDCRTFNADFRAFIDQHGLVDSVYTGIGSVTKPIGWAVGGVQDIANAVSGLTGGISNVGNILKVLIPVLAITAGIVIAIRIWKQKDK